MKLPVPETLIAFSITLLVALSPAAGGTGSASRDGDAGPDDRPDVLFFLSDDQRDEFLGCYGHPFIRTPTIDSLAARGVRFRNSFVTTSICAASRASILTALPERTHGFTFGTPPIRSGHARRSYPRLLRDAGWRTGFVGKFGVRVERGEREAMFDVFEPLGRNPYFKKQPDGSKRHVTEIAGDRAIEFLRSSPAERPLCLSVSFNAAHAEDSDKKDHFPWPKAVDGLYDDTEIPPPRLVETFDSQPEFLKESLNRKRWFWRWDTPEKYRRNVRAYYRMITGLDRVIGRVLQAHRGLDRGRPVVVIFSGDNGYYRGDRGFAGKWSHYEESLRVPLVIADSRLPASRHGAVVDAMALNIDIPATILEAAGVERPASWVGRGLGGWLRGETPEGWRDDAFFEHLMDHAAIPKWEGVRSERWKYARYFEEDPPYEFLHDLEDDPDEVVNLASDPAHADSLARLRARTDELRDRYGGPYEARR